MAGVDPTRRFSDRAEAYRRFRPSYPPGAIDAIVDACGLSPGGLVVDLGSGTGKLTELLLARGLRVTAVEPNAEMRAAAEAALAGRPGFTSVAARAEATGLPDGCAGAVTAAQAFHWFEPEAARAEVRRILVPGGRAALVWNVRDDADPFMAAYEVIIVRHGTSRPGQGPEWGDASKIEAFFGHPVAARIVPYAHVLDWEGLCGRLLSASYAPLPGHPGHEPMMQELAAAFDAHQRGGTVEMRYRTEVYAGPVSEPAR